MKLVSFKAAGVLTVNKHTRYEVRLPFKVDFLKNPVQQQSSASSSPVRMRQWHFHYLPHNPVFHMGQAGVIIHLRKCCC